jgi:hypothetical protein
MGDVTFGIKEMMIAEWEDAPKWYLSTREGRLPLGLRK